MTPEMILGVLFARFVVLLVTRLRQQPVGQRDTGAAPRWHDEFDHPV